MSDDPITVLIADDHPVVREGLAALFATDPGLEVSACVSGGMEAVEACCRLRPRVVVMDLLMPDMDGIEAMRRIRAKGCDTKAVLLTSYEGADRLEEAIEAGVTSYLLKTMLPEELLLAVKRTADDLSILSPHLARHLMAQSGRRDYSQGQCLHESLTEREREVLQSVAEGRTNAEIAEALGLRPKTVKTHVSNILSKLQVRDRTQAAVYAWKHQLV